MALVEIIGGGIIPFTAAAGGGPVLTNLVAWYKFDDGSGQVLTDYSGNGNHGQLGSTAGADTNDPTWVAEGLSFDGVDNSVLLPLSAADDWTVQVVASKVITTSNKVLLSQETQDPDGRETALMFFPATTVVLKASNGLAAVGQASVVSTDADLANFHVFTGRVDRAAFVKLAIDDFALTGQDTNVSDKTSTFNKFGRYYTTLAFSGKIAYAVLYNTVLSDADVSTNYAFLKAAVAPRGITLP